MAAADSADPGEAAGEAQWQQQIAADCRHDVRRGNTVCRHIGDGELVAVAEIQWRAESRRIVGHERQDGDECRDDDHDWSTQRRRHGFRSVPQCADDGLQLRPEYGDAQQCRQAEGGATAEIRRDAQRAEADLGQRERGSIPHLPPVDGAYGGTTAANATPPGFGIIVGVFAFRPKPQPDSQCAQREGRGERHRIEVAAEQQVAGVRPQQHGGKGDGCGGQRCFRRDAGDDADDKQCQEQHGEQHEQQHGGAAGQHVAGQQSIRHEQQHGRQHAEIRVPVAVVVGVIPVDRVHAFGEQPRTDIGIVRIRGCGERVRHVQVQRCSALQQCVGDMPVLVEIVGVPARFVEHQWLAGQLRDDAIDHGKHDGSCDA